ncbi:uncharacterized protein K460DRAFT_400247 [Cucurbitaria berberidis CBS 394.84]|uniref:Uncharacterized protein n=1 Tax=Cucurbitaria berberidis CBS 394.84 TaxID=1168544 RepID=A0A9P4GRS5_9PLEO|nr:uncharacterized protein K460DRAFT_400247 [Cucurbitaria berberidis CBS 394.84]KAF1850165.1 hypothetical protein K460DRAFT_400247 [Cucurbitaria berberidis CBS 394.84]
MPVISSDFSPEWGMVVLGRTSMFVPRYRQGEIYASSKPPFFSTDVGAGEDVCVEVGDEATMGLWLEICRVESSDEVWLGIETTGVDEIVDVLPTTEDRLKVEDEDTLADEDVRDSRLDDIPKESPDEVARSDSLVVDMDGDAWTEESGVGAIGDGVDEVDVSDEDSIGVELMIDEANEDAVDDS